MKTTAIVLAALLASSAAAAPQKPCARSPVLYIAQDWNHFTPPGFGYGPIPKDCRFVLNRDTVVIQKIDGGYLITGNSQVYALDFDVAILLTKQKLDERAHPDGFAVYRGTATYTTLRGFEKIVPLFQETK